MPFPAETEPTSPSGVALPRRRPMRMTPDKLRAQRANAKRSTGPRTVHGKRRSARNRRKFPFWPALENYLRWRGADLAEVRRLWQDLLAVFWFVEPDCSAFLRWAAFAGGRSSMRCVRVGLVAMWGAWTETSSSI
jgi:hypothetical protein